MVEKEFTLIIREEYKFYYIHTIDKCYHIFYSDLYPNIILIYDGDDDTFRIQKGFNLNNMTALNGSSFEDIDELNEESLKQEINELLKEYE